MTLVYTYGGLGGNTYLTATMADSLIVTTILNYSAWTNATVPQREISLIQATRDVDSFDYVGTRYYFDQTLLFPRRLSDSFPWGYTDVSTILGDTEQVRMQWHVQQATAIQALHLLKTSLAGASSHLENIQNGVKSWSEGVGPLNVSVTYGEASGGLLAMRNPELRMAPEAMAMLRDYRCGRRIYRA